MIVQGWHPGVSDFGGEFVKIRGIPTIVHASMSHRCTKMKINALGILSAVPIYQRIQ